MGSRGKIIKHLDFIIYIYIKPKMFDFQVPFGQGENWREN